MIESKYNFVKDFSKAAQELFEKTGEMPVCMIEVVAPVKLKKGTKNSPSPFYDRDMVTEDDNERYTIYARKSYSFKYGDRYENHVEEGHVFREVNEGEDPLKTKPEPDCPMISLNRSGKLCLDVVAPKKDGATFYFERVGYSDGEAVFENVGFENETNERLTQINEWKPTHNGPFVEPIFMQFGLNTIQSLSLINGDETKMFVVERPINNQTK